MKQNNFDKAIQYLQESKEYPENLGRGKPYDPDYTIQDNLIAICQKAKNKDRKTFQIAPEVKKLIDKVDKKYN